MSNLIKHYDFTKMTSLPDSDFIILVGEKWPNNELQEYVDSSDNLFFDNGLVIKATFKDGKYRSARISTRGKFAFKYGKVEIIAKLPKGKGTWPALWMMSQSAPYGRWPRSGEIDIMEHVGRKPGNVFMCLHTEAYNHRMDSEYYFENHIDGVMDDFHKYAIDWSADRITYYIDDLEQVSYSRFDKEDQTHRGWPFDHEFFLIINLAIGGIFGGDVDDSIFPTEFIIKDIKVYQ